MADEKLKKQAEALMRGRFENEETARGFYPTGLFDHLKAKGQFGPAGEDAASHYQFLRMINSMHLQMIGTLESHGQREEAAAILEHMRSVHSLLDTLTAYTDEIAPGDEKELLGALKIQRGALGKLAAHFTRFALPADQVAEGSLIVPEPMATDIRNMAKGLYYLQAQFDSTLGNTLDETGYVAGDKTPKHTNMRRLQGEALRFVEGSFTDDAIAGTSWGSMYDDIVLYEGEDDARKINLYHGVNIDHLSAIALLLRGVDKHFAPRFEDAVGKAKTAFEVVERFQKEPSYALQVMAIQQPFEDLAIIVEQASDKLASARAYIPDMIASGQVPDLAAKMKDHVDAEAIQGIIDRLPAIAEGYEAIQARFDATLGRHVNALRDNSRHN